MEMHEKVIAQAMFDQVEEYLKLTAQGLDDLWQNRKSLSAVEVMALQYTRGLLTDHKIVVDYLDRKLGKPVQKLVTKDETDRESLRKLSDEEFYARLREQGIDPKTGLIAGESFEEPEEEV